MPDVAMRPDLADWRRAGSADELFALEREIAELRARLAAAEQLADSDMLTPLVNRRCMEREIDRAIAQHARHETPAAFLFADMNGLKTINDRHGHAAGDAALVYVAELLMRETRASDLVGRIGGDEFGVLMAQADERATAVATARIKAAVAVASLLFRGRLLPIGLAIGATTITAHDTAAAVLARADAAMYTAKDGLRAQRSDR